MALDGRLLWQGRCSRSWRCLSKSERVCHVGILRSWMSWAVLEVFLDVKSSNVVPPGSLDGCFRKLGWDLAPLGCHPLIFEFAHVRYWSFWQEVEKGDPRACSRWSLFVGRSRRPLRECVVFILFFSGFPGERFFAFTVYHCSQADGNGQMNMFFFVFWKTRNNKGGCLKRGPPTCLD